MGYAENVLRRLLDELQERYEAGEIDEEEYLKGEREAYDGYDLFVDSEVDYLLGK